MSSPLICLRLYGCVSNLIKGGQSCRNRMIDRWDHWQYYDVK